MINYAVLHFCPSPKKHVYMHDELLLCSWRLTMSEEGALSVRFREPKTFCEEEEIVEKAVPSSTKYKNKWALSVFGEWQFARTIKVPVLDPGGLFKDYDLQKVATVSTGIEEMDALSLNYWLIKWYPVTSFHDHFVPSHFVPSFGSSTDHLKSQGQISRRCFQTRVRYRRRRSVIRP